MKSLLRSIKYSLNFPLRVIKTRRNLYPIDKESPFKGPLSENGVYHQKISDKCIDELKNFYSDSGENPNSLIHLRKHQASIVKEVFETINPIGTNEINSFDFDPILLQITAFAEMLDPAHLSNDGNSSHYSVLK